MAETTTALRLQLDNIAKLAGTDVASLMKLLEGYPQKEWAEVIRATLPQILETYSAASIDISASYYNKKRESIIKKAGDDLEVKPRTRGLTAAEFKANKNSLYANSVRQGVAKVFKKSMDYHVGRAFNEVTEKAQEDAPKDVPAVADPPALLPEELAAKRQQIADNLELEIRKHIFNASRWFIEDTSDTDPIKLKTRRVLSPSGCNFCKIQIYHEEEHHGFHKGCKCTIDFDTPEAVDNRTEAFRESFKKDYEQALNNIEGPRTDSKIVAELDRITQERQKEKTK
jgi:hypothetical protein